MALNKPDQHELASCLSIATKAFGLTISLWKAEVLLQPSQGLVPSRLHIVQYLGSTVTSTCSMDKEVSNKLAEAGASFSRLWT